MSMHERPGRAPDEAQETIDPAAWLVEILEGPGGLRDFETREWASQHTAGLSREAWVGRWVLRCLANPACTGSREMLAAIMAQREAREGDEVDTGGHNVQDA